MSFTKAQQMCNHLVDTLDCTGEPWNLWRAATGKWFVQRGKGRTDPASRTVGADTIPEVLQLAVNSKRLPVVPRKPRLCHYAYEKQGTGSRPWKITRDGRPVMNLKLKCHAQVSSERLREDQTKARDAWNREYYIFTETHAEGVDFYWEDYSP